MEDREARLHADGSCELYDYVDEVLRGHWASVASWASDWLDECRRGQYGPASAFANAMTYEAPTGAVDALATLAEAANDDATLLSYIGAGPLESLVSHSGNGIAVLDEVVSVARQNTAFRRALSGVWLSDVSQEVRTRLASFGARDFAFERTMTDEQAAAYFRDRSTRGWLG